MFLCLPIIFIISISDTRSERSLSVASSAQEGGCVRDRRPSPAQVPAAPALSSLTFEHLHGHSDRLRSPVLVDADGLCHDHLAEAALPKRFAQGQPGGRDEEAMSTPACFGLCPRQSRRPSTTASSKPFVLAPTTLLVKMKDVDPAASHSVRGPSRQSTLQGVPPPPGASIPGSASSGPSPMSSSSHAVHGADSYLPLIGVLSGFGVVPPPPPRGYTHVSPTPTGSEPGPSAQGHTATTDRALDSSHLGSAGSSSSETLASAGPSPEDSRAMRTSGVLEFMDELDSKDTCLGQQEQVGVVGPNHGRGRGEGIAKDGEDAALPVWAGLAGAWEVWLPSTERHVKIK